MKRFYLSVISIIFFANCYNPFTKYYTSIPEFSSQQFRQKRLSWVVPVTDKKEIKFYITENMDYTAEVLMENGYMMLGYSKFNDDEISRKQAINAAFDLGSSLVVVQSKYLRTVTETVPYEQKDPDRTHIIEDIQYNDTGSIVARNKKYITIEGEYRTTYVQQTRELYDHHATFWAKLKNIRIGLFVSDLTDEIKQILHTNRGVKVNAVIKGSPAFNADIMNNDVILEINGERINERRHFFRTLNKFKGSDIELKIWRKGSEIIKKIKCSDEE